MAANWFSFSDPLNSGVDFYTADAADVAINSSASVSLTIDSFKIAFTSVTLSSNTDASITSYKIAQAAVALSGLSATVSVATERQDALVSVSANTTMTVSMMKFANGSVTTTRTNLILNPTFEVDTSNWVGQSGATIARSTADQVSGVASLLVTSSAIDYNAVVLPTRIAVSPNITYSLSAYCKNISGSTRLVYIGVQWYTAAGAYISEINSAGQGTLSAAAGWVRRTTTGTAPSNAASAQIFMASGTTGLTAGWQTAWDAVLFEQSSSVLPYFDGAGVAPYTGYTLLSVSWNGATNASTSTSTWTTTSASANLSQTVTKIANSASVLSSSANATVAAIKIARAAVVLSSSASLTSAGTKLAQAISALSSSLQLTVAGKITLATIRIVLEEVGALAVQTPIVFAQNVASGIDASIYRTLILLDGKPLTIHNRKLDMGVDQIFTETVNWNNRKTRYYKSNSRAGRRTFSMSWSWLPNSINYTVDGNSGRDFIKKVAEDPRHHVLKIINMDETGTTPYSETSYNVLVKDYSETLIRRDIPNDVYFWDCSMSLEEV